MVEEINREQFAEKVKTGISVVDFWAPWCGPCKMMAPVFEELDKEMENINFLKVNVDENQELAQEFGVQGIPTLLVFKDGEETQRIVGFSPKENIKSAIEKAI